MRTEYKAFYNVQVATGTSVPSDAIDVDQKMGYAIHAKWVVPAAKTFAPTAITVAAKTITIPSHGYYTGYKGQFTSATTLPTGYLAITDYFVVVVDANTIKVSDTYAHAIAGTNIVDPIDQGTGNHTFTPTSLSACSAELQASNDNVNYITVASSSQNITATSEYMWNITDVFYKYVKLVGKRTDGNYSISASFNVKGF